MAAWAEVAVGQQVVLTRGTEVHAFIVAQVAKTMLGNWWMSDRDNRMYTENQGFDVEIVQAFSW